MTRSVITFIPRFSAEVYSLLYRMVRRSKEMVSGVCQYSEMVVSFAYHYHV